MKSSRGNEMDPEGGLKMERSHHTEASSISEKNESFEGSTSRYVTYLLILLPALVLLLAACGGGGGGGGGGT